MPAPALFIAECVTFSVGLQANAEQIVIHFSCTSDRPSKSCGEKEGTRAVYGTVILRTCYAAEQRRPSFHCYTCAPHALCWLVRLTQIAVMSMLVESRVDTLIRCASLGLSLHDSIPELPEGSDCLARHTDHGGRWDKGTSRSGYDQRPAGCLKSLVRVVERE